MRSAISAFVAATCGVCSAVANAQTASPAQSASAEPGLQEVVVTAQRRAENLQTVPVTVTAVNAAQLTASGIDNTQDLALVVPGLNIPQAQVTQLPHLRGVGSTTVAAGAENSVATYVDGVYYATAAGSLTTFNNISRVEVLKGPQGTLFGRNATGGLIQIITADPTQDAHGNVEVGYGNYKTGTLDGYITGGLTHSLAADLAVQMTYQGDGYGHNLFNNESTYKTDRDVGLRSKFLWAPSDDTSIRLSLDYRNLLSTQGAIAQAEGQYNVFYPPNVVQVGQFNVNENVQPLDDMQAGGASLKIDQNVGFGHFVSITAWRDQHLRYTVDFDLGPAAIIGDDVQQKDSQFSQEFQLQSATSSPLQWTVGLYYFHADDSYDPVQLSFGGPASAPIGPGAFLTGVATYATQKTDSFAGYGQATYQVAQNTNLTAGIRATYEKKDFDGSQIGTINDAVQAPFGSVSDSISKTKPTWRLALDHTFDNGPMAYVSYNRGFKSGGFNTNDIHNAPYQPEQLDAYEIGLKSQFFDNRFRLNGAGFYYDYKDIQVSRFVAGVPDIYNGAKAEMYGLDVDFEAAVTSALTLTGGLEVMHSKFKDFPCADHFAGGPNFNDAACGQTATPSFPYLASANGNEVPDAPNFTASIGVDYEVPLFGGLSRFNVTDAYNNGYFFESDNNLKQSSYNIVNASIQWNTLNDRFLVRVWGRNLSNENYSVQLASASTGVAQAWGAPRTYGITLGVKF